MKVVAERAADEAVRGLYAAQWVPMVRLATMLLRDQSRAEDIVQETFLRMFGFLSGLRENTPLRPWLKRVAANLAIDRLRRQQHPGTDMALAALADTASASPADAADADTLLRRLPPLARTVVWLHEMEGWSHEDLGRRFGRTASWSKSLMSRSLARLRQDLDPHGDAPHDA